MLPHCPPDTMCLQVMVVGTLIAATVCCDDQGRGSGDAVVSH